MSASSWEDGGGCARTLPALQKGLEHLAFGNPSGSQNLSPWIPSDNCVLLFILI